ncbi:MAG: hypothetical protein HRT35_24410, partial [Algicola sp.]|nr:hypothetical protein [Algicola sp.]
MKLIKQSLLLTAGLVLTLQAQADQSIDGNLVVMAVSDGTTLAYNCSAPTLPFFFPGGVDESAAIGVIPAGEPLVAVNFTSCQFGGEQPYQCSFTCEPIAAAACVGFDCIKGEALAPGEFKLKENNIRVRLVNSAVSAQAGGASVFGESWNVEVNSTINNGPSYFGFQVKSVNPDTLLSDGTAVAYDCADLGVTKYEPFLVPTTGYV